MDREKLEAAAKQGLITTAQIEPLLSFFTTETETPTSNAEEQLRFVRSFGDIFITLGIVFVALAGAQVEMSAMFNLIPIAILFATTEWLVRNRRLALPGIALLIATLYFASQLIGPENTLQVFIMITVLSVLFYWRYKMPFTLAPICAGSLGIISVLLGKMGVDIRNFHYIFIFYGLMVFAVAMWFDSRDIKRENRFSDTAFWLHLMAAPLVVHGVMITLLSMSSSEFLIIIFFVMFFLLALYVDRRAILVSSLGYAIYAIIQYSKTTELNIENITLIIFAVFGSFIVLFGVYWYKIRKIIFFSIKDSWISHYVPPINR